MRIDALYGIGGPVVPIALSQQACAMLKDFGLDQKKYKSVYDNNVQQVLHNELVAIANNMPILYKKFRNCAPLHSLNQLLLESLDAAGLCNDFDDLVMASQAADFCWAALHFLQEAGIGAFKGFKHGLTNYCTHPVNLMADACKTASSVFICLSLQEELERCSKPQELQKIIALIDEEGDKILKLDTLKTTTSTFKAAASILAFLSLGAGVEECHSPQEMQRLNILIDEVGDQALLIAKKCEASHTGSD